MPYGEYFQCSLILKWCSEIFLVIITFHVTVTCSAHLHEIDAFVTEAMDVLTVMPQSVEEIGDANLQYSRLQQRKPEVSIAK